MREYSGTGCAIAMYTFPLVLIVFLVLGMYPSICFISEHFFQSSMAPFFLSAVLSLHRNATVQRVPKPENWSFIVHSHFMTNLHVGQVFSCWSNVSPLRFDQHVGQLTNLWQWVTLTFTNIWLKYDQDMSMTLVNSSPKSTPSNDYDMTNLWLRFDQVFLV